MVGKNRKRQAPLKEFCEQATRLIADYLSGELDRKTAIALEKHLILCPDCVSFLTTYKETLRAARSLRYEDMPAEMQERVHEFLRGKIKGAEPGR